jgi:hypothetical protein
MPTINSGSNSLTTPTTTSGSYIGYKLANDIGGDTSITYFQRVYSVGSNQWCYYTSLGSLNPSPASTATSPNWVGSFSNFQVLSSK